MKDKESLFRKELKHIGDILLPFLIYYVSYFLAAIILTFIVITILQNLAGVDQSFFIEYEATINGAVGGLAMLIGIVPLWTSFRQEITTSKREKREVFETKSGKEKELEKIEVKKAPYVKIPVTMLLAFSSSIAVNILFILLHLTENSETYQEVAANQYGVLFGLGILLYGMVSPLAEEVVFRGLIYNRMKKYYSVRVSIILSALLFGLYHGNLVQGIYGFIMGCLIAYTYERFGSFWYAFLFHATANAAVYTITGSETIYQFFITSYHYIIFTIISVILIFVIEKMKNNKKTGVQ